MNRGRTCAVALLAAFIFMACGQSTPVATSLPPAITPVPADPLANFPLTMVKNPRSSADSFQAGITLLIYGNDLSYQKETLPLLNRLADDNINSLAIVFPLYQSNRSAADVHADPLLTPSNVELKWIIKQAKARGFSILLRPVLDEAAVGPFPHWRGDIQPSDPTLWFANYSDVMFDYATLAQESSVDSLDIGSEWNSMEHYTDAWTTLINRLRGAFSGALTYSSNWDAHLATPVATQLNFISVDGYYPLTHLPRPTVEQIVDGWRVSALPDLTARTQASGVPVVLTEIGVIPYDSIFAKPWSWSATGPYNPTIQQNYYIATCIALKPAVAGIYWWEIGLTQPAAPNGGFDPLVLPTTEQAMKDCYAT